MNQSCFEAALSNARCLLLCSLALPALPLAAPRDSIQSIPLTPCLQAPKATPLPSPPPTHPPTQVLILLETEEIVEQPWRRPVQGGGTGAIRRVYDEHLELTADTGCTHFLFTIPPDASASFHTPLLQLRWLLRFQFTAAMPPSGDAGGEWNPLAGRIEQLSWSLPITVLPPVV